MKFVEQLDKKCCNYTRQGLNNFKVPSQRTKGKNRALLCLPSLKSLNIKVSNKNLGFSGINLLQSARTNLEILNIIEIESIACKDFIHSGQGAGLQIQGSHVQITTRWLQG